MNATAHLSQPEIRSLLLSKDAIDDREDMVRHVGQCSHCQQSMETVAADPDFWCKATKWLNETDLASRPSDALSSNEVASDPEELMTELLDAPSHPELLGSVPGYDIECEIGRGGMGVVFKAFDQKLHRTVAIKFLSPHLASNGTARQRFAREARAVAAVFHPNVIAVHGVSSHRDVPYLVMPYVSGPSLQRLIDQHGPLEEKELIRIALQITAGLSAAHLQGLVHRDIKPANVLVEADVSRVSVTDFGLARAIDDASMTQSGMFLGTPNYMSPEQATGRQIDARSDLFSLGSVMYFLATGRLPFRAESPVCVLHRITHDQPVSVAELNSEISTTTCQIIGRLLSKDCDSRFASAADLHGVLQHQLAHLNHPTQKSPPVVSSRSSRGLRVKVGLAAGVVIVLLWAGAFAINPDDGSGLGNSVEKGKSAPAASPASLPVEAQRAEKQAEQDASASQADATQTASEAEQRRESAAKSSVVPKAPAAPVPPTPLKPPTIKAKHSFWRWMSGWLLGS